MNLDLAVKTGQFEIWLALFTPSTPKKLFNIDNPRQTLELSIMEPKRRASQCKQYLEGINPVGFASMVNLGNYYSMGVSACGQKSFGFNAIAHMLSRHLSISAEKAEKMITKKFEQGYTKVVFIKYSNSRGCENLENDRWIILKAVPTQDERLQKMNTELRKRGSKFQAETSKTYAVKVYGI